MILLTLLCISEVDPKTAIFSWRFIDGPLSFVDPIELSLPSFENWTFPNSENTHEGETDNTRLNYNETAEINFIFSVSSAKVYNYFSFQCLSVEDEPSDSANCIVSTSNEIVEIELGKFYNFTSIANLDRASINITLINNGTSSINFLLPKIIVYRHPYYTDVSLTRQYPVKGQTKAVFSELYLNENIGKIELHTIHIGSQHKIPSTFIPYNQIFNEEGNTSFEFTTLPIISSETRIIGMNIFDSTLKLWRLFESDDKSEFSYCININPVPPFRVSYIVIETASLNFPDALEIWHNQFNNSLFLPDPQNNYGSIATPADSGTYCVNSFYQRHMWGGDIISGFPSMKTFLPIPKFNITLSVSPESISQCADNKNDPFYDNCLLIQKFGIVTEENVYSVTTEEDGNYTYDLIWSPNVESAFNSVNNQLNENGYSGFSIDLAVAQTMNYNEMISDPQYFLIDKNGNRFKPMISSMYQLLYYDMNQKIIENGNILISDFFHPQFINVILTQGVVVDLIDPKNSNKLRYLMSTHNRLWRVRAQMGSRIFTILEENDPRSVYSIADDFFSICITVGALPSFYYPKWAACASLDYLGKLNSIISDWDSRFRLVLFNTNYYANGMSLIQFNTNPNYQIPPIPGLESKNVKNSQKKKKKIKSSTRSDSIYIDEDDDDDESNTSSYVYGTLSESDCFYEASTYCEQEVNEEDGLINCYEVVLVGINYTLQNPNDQIKIQRVVSATFSVEKDPVCFYVASPLTCSVDGFRVDLNLSVTVTQSMQQIYRAAIISFKYRVGQSLEDWVRENLGAIVGALLCILLLFIGMGFGFWYMCCRKRKDKEDLARIMNKESIVRKEKQNNIREQNKKKEIMNDKYQNDDSSYKEDELDEIESEKDDDLVGIGNEKDSDFVEEKEEKSSDFVPLDDSNSLK